MKKRWLLSLIAIFILSAFLLRGKIPHEKFESTLWKTANLDLEENMSLRWDMMNDLRTKYKLVGMTKIEIIDLLGRPENITGAGFSYYLGFSKKGINTGSLVITFNDKDIVTKTTVWQE